jgi:thymidylate synthase
MAKLEFPLVDAFLLIPEEGKDSVVAVCTNTSSPGEVFNEIESENRKMVSVMGTLIANRDGAERMIINSLAHPTLQYIVLFSTETITFSPSTNLLLAVQNGIDPKSSNSIIDGRAGSPHYPNLSEKIVNMFRDNITLIPLFMYESDFSKEVIMNYLEWLRPKVGDEIYNFLKEASGSKKIYYDMLNKFLELAEKLPNKNKDSIDLDPKDFQHLQPPKVCLERVDEKPEVPFKVSNNGEEIRLDIEVDGKLMYIQGKDEFLIEYSLMKFLADRKKDISVKDQLLLGAELGRVNNNIKSELDVHPFVTYKDISGTERIPLESNLSLVTDKKFYYKINVKDDEVSVGCLAFDVCDSVFDLRSKDLMSIINWLAENNRFEEYEMDILHRMDVASQVCRAVVAASLGYSFIQDFYQIFKTNTTKLPFVVADSDSFLDVHKKLLTKIYTQGLTEEHGDKRKGLARSVVGLAIYRNSPEALKTMPVVYKQGELDTPEVRKRYKEQLLRFDHDGSYSYGERTRAFFGFDQLEKTVEILKKDKSLATIVQRFDPSVDMGTFVDEDGRVQYTHDPCLTHDIFLVKDDVLHSFHIARAHNTVNAYPENIFGLYDAYVSKIRDDLGLKGGDMYMLSSRANILLLTEEQRTKKLLSEPSKPAHDFDTSSGPYLLGRDVKGNTGVGISYFIANMEEVTEKPSVHFIDRLFNLRGVNTVERSIEYLKSKGVSHNNPVLSSFDAREDNPQGEHLVFLQSNVFGKKLYTTVVFSNRDPKNFEEDVKSLNYISTLFSKELNFPLGELVLFYIN